MTEKAIYAILAADTDVAALVATRIYPVRRVQGDALPAIVYRRISSTHIHSTQGSSGACNARIQIDCWAATYAGAKTLADKVRLALDGYHGTAGTIDVHHILIEDETDLAAGFLGGEDTQDLAVTMDLSVFFSETPPT